MKFLRRLVLGPPEARPFFLEVVCSPEGNWHTRIKARNGEIVQSAETYANASNAWRAANAMQADTGWEVRLVDGRVPAPVNSET